MSESSPERNKFPAGTTAGKAAALLNVSSKSVQNAKTVLRDGTAEEVEAIQRGEASVTAVAKQIRAKVPAEQRKARRGDGLSAAGKNPEQIERMKMDALLWQQM